MAEHRETEKNMDHILKSAVYRSGIVCYSGLSGHSLWEDLAARKQGSKGYPLQPMNISPPSTEDCALASALEGEAFLNAIHKLNEADFLIEGLSSQSRHALSRMARRGLIQGRWLRASGKESSSSRRRSDSMNGNGIVKERMPYQESGKPSGFAEAREPVPSGMDGCDLEDLIERIIRYDDVGVLIQGESGTGKTRLARRIHAEGPRRRGPLMEVNCGCIPMGMIESELFGHVRGAFTGASGDRVGKIRSADGGILFLDEVGELGLDIQVRLLKVLEDRLVIPLGSERAFKVDVRIIAASNRDLLDMVRSGSFRFDLYSRLNQIAVRLPPLRERRGEILRLAREILKAWNIAHSEKKGFTKGALSAMEACPWPGNYRQLIHAVHCACVRADGDHIGECHLPLDEWGCGIKASSILPAIPEGGVNLKELMSSHEWGYYQRALMQSGWRPGGAARLLGMTGHAFRKALRERYAEKYQEMMRDTGAERHGGNASPGDKL